MQFAIVTAELIQCRSQLRDYNLRTRNSIIIRSSTRVDFILATTLLYAEIYKLMCTVNVTKYLLQLAL